MSKGILARLIAVLSLLLLTACSSTEYTPLTKDASPSLNNSLMVMGIKWIENYTEPETRENISVTSYELLNDADLILKRQVEQGKPELHKALYYLSYFDFQFTDDKGKKHNITRFGKNMLEYENIALYEFKPGTYTLNGFKMRQLQLEEDKRGRGETRWQLAFEEYEEEIGPWNLQAGKIVYLGDMTLYFKTEKIERGILTPEIVNKSIKLEKITIEDKFEQMKSAIKEQKSWFPVDKMVNNAMDKEWVYIKPEVPSETEGDKSKTKKKDENSFY